MTEKEEKFCEAPDANGKACGKKMLAKGHCSAHYQQVYHHGEITNRHVGRKKCDLRLRIENKLKRYRGHDAMRDIPLKFEGDERRRARMILWQIVRGPKNKAGSS